MKQIATWIGIILVIILAVVGLVKLSNSAGGPPNPSATNAAMPKISSVDNQKGDLNSKVTLVEYGDFQCPACGAEYPVVEQLLKSGYDNKVRFVFRNMPLVQVHPNAMAGAQAAYAASKQGKFWPMYDLLYQHQSDWADTSNPTKVFDQYAKKLNLNLDAYHKVYNDPNTQKFINDQETAGINAGVNATPTFFVNGKILQSNVPPSYDQLKKLLDDELAKK